MLNASFIIARGLTVIIAGTLAGMFVNTFAAPMGLFVSMLIGIGLAPYVAGEELMKKADNQDE